MKVLEQNNSRLLWLVIYYLSLMKSLYGLLKISVIDFILIKLGKYLKSIVECIADRKADKNTFLFFEIPYFIRSI